MNNEQCMCRQPNCNGQCSCGVKCISWSAIILGAIIAVGLSFLLNVFSVAIGLSAFNMSEAGVKTLAVGGLIGILIGTIAVMFFSGWIAGFLGRVRCAKGTCGGLYGLAVWCVALILMALVAGSLGKFVESIDTFIATPTYTSVVATTHDAAPIVATNKAVPSQVVVNTDKVSAGTFALFAIFLFGAFASVIGGHCGLRCCCNKSEKCNHMNNNIPPANLS